MRTLLGKANFSEMGRKSVTLGDDFLIQRSELGEGRYYYHTISDVRDADGFVVIIIQNAMYIAIPHEAFADGGAEFCAELRAKLAGFKKG